MSKVTVIDYGVGNLLSVCRAFEHCGAEVELTGEPSLVEKADRLILPGVGAFSDGMEGLRTRGLISAIKNFATKERPFLGICLGMQMMMEVGEEFGIHEGLGLIPGRVTKIPDTGIDGKEHKIPHIGWNGLVKASPDMDWEQTILRGIGAGTTAYFVHSFTAMPADEPNRLADCHYNGRIISAAIYSGYLYGCQYHPEKSGPAGLKMLGNFLAL